MSKSIIAIGNALMDVVVKLENDDILSKNNMPRGSMTLVDATVSNSINEQTNGLEKVLVPGGSVCNTVNGLAHLGTRAAFIGKVGNDETGKLYESGLKEVGAQPKLFVSETTPTGKAMGLISTDGERTFGTYLGAAIELSADDLSQELFEGFNIAYIEGYLVQNHDLIRKAAELAKAAGLQIAIDLASFNVVEANIAFLQDLVSNYVDIIFANEEEAKAFTGKEPREALNILSNLVDIAIVKIGSKGSLMKHGDKVFEIGTVGGPCNDSTGAGDLYAAGFLHGYSNGLPLEYCGKIAAITSGKIITVYGARMNNEMWNSIETEITNLID